MLCLTGRVSQGLANTLNWQGINQQGAGKCGKTEDHVANTARWKASSLRKGRSPKQPPQYNPLYKVCACLVGGLLQQTFICHAAHSR